jgi:hypothetical protein
MLNERGSNRGNGKIFSLLENIMTVYPDHLAGDSVGTAQGTVYLWLKRSGREAVGRIRSSTLVKNAQG